MITLDKSINYKPKFGFNGDLQTDDGDMINKTNYSSLHQLFIGNLTWVIFFIVIVNNYYIVAIGANRLIEFFFTINYYTIGYVVNIK